MIVKIYDFLKSKGYNIYFYGQHQGVCTSPYVVVKDGGCGQVGNISLDKQYIDFCIYFPMNKSLRDFFDFTGNLIKDLNEQKAIRNTRYKSPYIIDSDKKAYTSILRFINYKNQK